MKVGVISAFLPLGPRLQVCCSGCSLQEGGKVDVLFVFYPSFVFVWNPLWLFSFCRTMMTRNTTLWRPRSQRRRRIWRKPEEVCVWRHSLRLDDLFENGTNCLIADRSPLDCSALVQTPAEWRRNYALDTETYMRHTYGIPCGEGFFYSPFYVNTASPADLAADAAWLLILQIVFINILHPLGKYTSLGM